MKKEGEKKGEGGRKERERSGGEGRRDTCPHVEEGGKG